MSERRVITVVKHSTMSPDMEKHAVLTAINALAKHNVEQHAARFIKESFDNEFGPQWHCVVGKQFGCFVSHFHQNFVYFYVNSVACLLYKTGDES